MKASVKKIADKLVFIKKINLYCLFLFSRKLPFINIDKNVEYFLQKAIDFWSCTFCRNLKNNDPFPEMPLKKEVLRKYYKWRGKVGLFATACVHFCFQNSSVACLIVI